MLPVERTAADAPERETLRSFLDQQRALVLWKLEGVSAPQAGETTVPSGTNLLGVVKHLAWVERWWFCDFIGGQTFDYPWSDEDPDADFRAESDDTVESVSALYVRAVGEANAVLDAAESLDITRQDRGEPRSLRWVVVHMIEETARHLGHMDIVREQLDGVTGYVPR